MTDDVKVEHPDDKLKAEVPLTKTQIKARQAALRAGTLVAPPRDEFPAAAVEPEAELVVDEETSDEETSDKETSDKETSDKETSDEETSDEETSDEETSDEETSDEETSDELSEFE